MDKTESRNQRGRRQRERNKERDDEMRAKLGVEIRTKVPRRPSQTKKVPLEALGAVNRAIEKDRLIEAMTPEV